MHYGAFILSKDDIDIIVTAYALLCGEGARLLDLNRIGREFWSQNLASVAYACGMQACKHKDHERALAAIEAYEFTPFAAKPEAIAKVTDCCHYQSSQHPQWQGSRAQKMLALIQRRWRATLPGYAAMPWGISSGADRRRAEA